MDLLISLYGTDLRSVVAMTRTQRVTTERQRRRIAAYRAQAERNLKRAESFYVAARARLDALDPTLPLPSVCAAPVEPLRVESPTQEAVVQAFMAAVGMDEAGLGEFIDDLALAYRREEAYGGEQAELYASALRTIGRHIAAQIGPKAAGVVLS